MVIAGYSFPSTDFKYMNSIFPPEVLPKDMVLVVVNLENTEESFKERVKAVFPKVRRMDFSCKDFNELCTKLD
jgi:hypothetical protein